MPNPTYTFTAGTTMRASEFNTNFALLAQCLGLSGGTLTGTLNSQDILPSTSATYGLGSISKLFTGIATTALKLADTNSSHLLSVVCGSNITANRTLTFSPGDADRTVTVAASCTIGGVAPIALGGTGLSAVPTNGQLLIGNGTDFTLASLSAGSNITITPGAGSISIAAASAADTTPVGIVSMWMGTSVPTADYEFLIGQDISRTTYAALWAIMGSPNTGNGSTTFTLPDMRQKFPIGKAASGTGSTLLGTGGNIDHTHSAASGGSHTHSLSLSTGTDGAHTHTITGATAGGEGHSHLLNEHTVDVQAGGDHTVPNSNFETGTESAHTHGAGTLSAASGGGHSHTVSGNTDADGSHTHTIGTGNPPFIAVNFIVRAK